jgi:hypothetical protein
MDHDDRLFAAKKGRYAALQVVQRVAVFGEQYKFLCRRRGRLLYRTNVGIVGSRLLRQLVGNGGRCENLR